MRYRVINVTRNTRLAESAEQAATFLKRFKGLMGRTSLPVGEGMLIEPCNSVHTFFMKLDIDVLFLDQARGVIDIAHSLAPWKMSRLYPAAKSVLELPSGTARAARTEPGDQLVFESV